LRYFADSLQMNGEHAVFKHKLSLALPSACAVSQNPFIWFDIELYTINICLPSFLLQVVGSIAQKRKIEELNGT